MGLEAATYIDDFVVTNPVAGDNVSQGDDHLRLLKSVLKATFPALSFARYLEQPRADLASATSPDLWAATTNYVNITGTTTIEDFVDATASGQMKIVRFDDELTLTHSASAIDLPTEDDIVTAAGDHAIFISQGTTVHQCIAYFRKDGTPLAQVAPAEATDELLGIVELATTAELRSTASGSKVVTTANVRAAMAPVTLTDAATVAVDWDTFFSSVLVLGGNRTLGNPSNGRPGTMKMLEVKSDGSDRTLSFGSNYRGLTATITGINTGLGQRALIALYQETTGGSHIVVAGVTRY